MSNEANILKDIANKLRREGQALIEQGNAKLEAANAIDRETAVLVHDRAESRSAAKEVTARKAVIGHLENPGWTEFLKTALAHGPKSLDDIVAQADANGYWADMELPARRTRLRTTLHVMKNNRNARVDEQGRWELVKV